MSDLKLGKPPVVEIVADFSFDPSPTNDWDPDRAKKFLASIVPEPRHVDMVGYVTVEPTSANEGKIPFNEDFSVVKGIGRLRCWNSSRDTCLQMAADRLIINKVKTSSYSPRFGDLMSEVKRVLAAYEEKFSIVGISAVTLRYLDDVDLESEAEHDRLDLEKYFNLNVRFPDAFGAINGFDVSMDWYLDAMHLRLTFATQAPYIFRLDWNARREVADEVIGISESLALLEQFHDELDTRFQASFTQIGMSLFNPRGSE